jgi:hypothetical protein
MLLIWPQFLPCAYAPRTRVGRIVSGGLSTGGTKHLRYSQASSREASPVRPERHVPSSIATIRRYLAVELIAALPGCPCYPRQQRRSVNDKMTSNTNPPKSGPTPGPFDTRFTLTAVRLTANELC